MPKILGCQCNSSEKYPGEIIHDDINYRVASRNGGCRRLKVGELSIKYGGGYLGSHTGEQLYASLAFGVSSIKLKMTHGIPLFASCLDQHEVLED